MSSLSLSPVIADFVGRLRSALDEIDAREVETVVAVLLDARRRGAHVYFGGNGGSAATADHFACDLHAAGRQGRRLKVSSLCDGLAILTATANDHGWTEVFADRLRGRVEPGDVVWMISASGDSKNVLNALRVAREAGATTVLFAGSSGGAAAALADHVLALTSRDFGVIESAHASLAHLVAACFRMRLDA